MKYFFRYIKDFFVELILPPIFLFALVVPVAMLAFEALFNYQCSSYESVTGKPTEYKLLDSCYVEFKGEWLRYSEYRGIRKDLYIKQELNQ